MPSGNTKRTITGTILSYTETNSKTLLVFVMQKVSPLTRLVKNAVVTIHGVFGTRYNSEALSIEVVSELVITDDKWCFTQKAPRDLAGVGWGSTNCEKSMFEPPVISGLVDGNIYVRNPGSLGNPLGMDLCLPTAVTQVNAQACNQFPGLERQSSTTSNNYHIMINHSYDHS